MPAMNYDHFKTMAHSLPAYVLEGRVLWLDGNDVMHECPEFVTESGQIVDVTIGPFPHLTIVKAAKVRGRINGGDWWEIPIEINGGQSTVLDQGNTLTLSPKLSDD